QHPCAFGPLKLSSAPHRPVGRLPTQPNRWTRFEPQPDCASVGHPPNLSGYTSAWARARATPSQAFYAARPHFRNSAKQSESGTISMGIARLTDFSRLAALLIVITAFSTGTANAQHFGHHGGLVFDEWAGYAVPIQDVYQFPAAIVWQPTSPFGYA